MNHGGDVCVGYAVDIDKRFSNLKRPCICRLWIAYSRNKFPTTFAAAPPPSQPCTTAPDDPTHAKHTASANCISHSNYTANVSTVSTATIRLPTE